MNLRNLLQLTAASFVVLMSVGCSAGGSGGGSTPTPVAVSVSFASAPPASLGVGGTTSVAATVSNDGNNAGVTWTVTCSSNACGGFNPNTTASGATTTYSAPAAVPASGNVTITATSVTDKTKSTSAVITIGGAPAPSPLADGTYVYHMYGQDNQLTYTVVGALTIKGGAIIGGEEDYTDSTTFNTNPLIPSASSITVTGGNMQLVLATADSYIGVNGVLTVRTTPVSKTRMLISEFDNFGAATGSLDLQTSNAQPSGGYAFAVNGVDSTADENQLSIGGVMSFTNGALNTAGSVFDYNDANNSQNGGTPVLLFGQAFSAGSVSVPDAFGRVAISLTPSTPGIGTIGLTGYVLDGHTIQMLSSQSDVLNADLGGTALAQGSNAGQFSAANVVGSTYVHSTIGQDPNGPATFGGYFVFGAGGSTSGNLIVNDLTNISGNTFAGASYSVSPLGRVVVNNIVPSNYTLSSLSFALYLDGSGNAMIMGADNFQQTAGQAYAQNGLSDYEGSFAIANMGFLNGPTYDQPSGAVGPVTISGDVFNGFTDVTWQDQNLLYPLLTPFDNQANIALAGSENSSTGTLQLSGLNSLSFSQPITFGYYPIDANRVLAVEVDNNGMGLLMLENSSSVTVTAGH